MWPLANDLIKQYEDIEKELKTINNMIIIKPSQKQIEDIKKKVNELKTKATTIEMRMRELKSEYLISITKTIIESTYKEIKLKLDPSSEQQPRWWTNPNGWVIIQEKPEEIISEVAVAPEQTNNQKETTRDMEKELGEINEKLGEYEKKKTDLENSSKENIENIKKGADKLKQEIDKLIKEVYKNWLSTNKTKANEYEEKREKISKEIEEIYKKKNKELTEAQTNKQENWQIKDEQKEDKPEEQKQDKPEEQKEDKPDEQKQDKPAEQKQEESDDDKKKSTLVKALWWIRTQFKLIWNHDARKSERWLNILRLAWFTWALTLMYKRVKNLFRWKKKKKSKKEWEDDE